MKFVISTLAAILISTPALAQHRHDRYHHGHHRHNSWVGPAVIGAIGTAIIIDQFGRQRQVIVENSPPVIISSTPPVYVETAPPVVTRPVVRCSVWREVEEGGRIFRERTCTEYPN